MFCISESVALIISNTAIITNLSPYIKETFETAAQLKEEVNANERNSMERFTKNSNFYSIDFLYFIAKR